MADGIRRVDVYPDDWLAGTYHLSLEEEGAYWRICCLIYSHTGPIDDDDRMLAAQMRTSQRHWRTVKNRLVEQGKITIEAGKIGQKRAIEELTKAAKRISIAKTRGKAGADKRWKKRPTGTDETNKNNGVGDSASNTPANSASDSASNASRAPSPPPPESTEETPKGLSSDSLGAATLASPSGDGSLHGASNPGEGQSDDDLELPSFLKRGNNGAETMDELLHRCGIETGARLTSQRVGQASYTVPGTDGDRVEVDRGEVTGRWPEVAG